MTKQELIETFWREIGIDCPAWAEAPELDWAKNTEVDAAAALVAERKIARFCAERGIVLEN